jgi:hypothetical protein
MCTVFGETTTLLKIKQTVNHIFAAAFGFQENAITLFSLKTVHMYRNMLEKLILCLY